jgi:hypothetical protein
MYMRTVAVEFIKMTSAVGSGSRLEDVCEAVRGQGDVVPLGVDGREPRENVLDVGVADASAAVTGATDPSWSLLLTGLTDPGTE